MEVIMRSKKILYGGVFVILILIVLLGIAWKYNSNDSSAALIETNQVPNDYSKAQAIEDNCVVYEELELISGDDIWNTFIEKSCENDKETSVRVVSFIDNVPYVSDLVYDGDKYYCYEEGKKSKGHQYIKEVSGTVSASGRTERFVVLTNDENITYEEITGDLVSSQSEDIFPEHYELISTLMGVE